MHVRGSVVAGGPGGDSLGLPMEPREGREAARARVEAKRAAQAAGSPFARDYAARAARKAQEPTPAPVQQEEYSTSPDLVEPAPSAVVAPVEVPVMPKPVPVPVEAAPVAQTAPASTPKPSLAPKPKPAPKPAPAPRRSRVDAGGIVQDYLDGKTIAQIASARGHTNTTVRNLLKATPGVTMRDDRATHSGGQKKVDDPALVELVRALYVDKELTQTEVGARLGMSAKGVQGVMTRNNIPARPDVINSGLVYSKQGQSTLTQLKQRMTDAGVTPAELRAWAGNNGIPVSPTGIPGQAVLDAYLQAETSKAPVDVKPLTELIRVASIACRELAAVAEEFSKALSAINRGEGE